MYDLWNQNQEKRFFEEALKKFSYEKLFYKTDNKKWVAYWEKDYKGKKTTLQSRNAPIGAFTENWVKDLFTKIAKKHKAYAVSEIVCNEIALTENSKADVAICKTDSKYQKPEDILMIIEVKMSIVWNWEYVESSGEIKYIGDFNSHHGTPSLLRSDSMLKAIGKSINIRISGEQAHKIPIVILGNTPITEHYYDTVDKLKQSGIVQGFWSINPSPLQNTTTIKTTTGKGFFRFDDYEELKEECDALLSDNREFFSGRIDKKELGNFIEKANNKKSLEDKADKFLRLLRQATKTSNMSTPVKHKKIATKTASFGSPGRSNHDASSFYNSRLYEDSADTAQKPSDYFENQVDPKYRNKILNKSSENMSELPDNSTALMITSPPYNVGKDYDQDLTLTEYRDLLASVFRETFRVLLPGGRACINIANVGRKPYIPLHAYIIEDMTKIGFLMRGEIIWDKGAGTASTAWGSWQKASNPVLRDTHEYILIFCKYSYTRENPHKKADTITKEEFLEYTKSIWSFPPESAKRLGHPAPFPVELPRRLIKLYSFQDDLILDPFNGAGSTCLAAQETKRNYIGYDTSEKYCQIAEKRLQKLP